MNRKEQINTHCDSWTPGWQFLDEFVIDREIGRGGMGSVYLVSSLAPDGGKFAVKTLLESTLENSRKRRQFLRELRTWINLPRHDNLTSCLFFQTVGDRMAIFSEYVNGGPLSRWIEEKRVVTSRDLLDIAIQIGRGLSAAHAGGVIHQDIKPSNILMSADGVAKLTDFGLSNSILARGKDKNLLDHSSGRMSDRVALTLRYCSPEQLSGGIVQSWSDIWSWGLIILEMCMGSAQWKIGAMAPMVFELYQHDPPDPPFPGVFPEIVPFLEMCFQEDVEKRWSSAETAVSQLISIYQSITGDDYPRPECIHDANSINRSTMKLKLASTDNGEVSPRTILRSAMIRAGYSQEEIDSSFLPTSEQGSTQALIDLELLEKAESILKRLSQAGVSDLTFDLYDLHTERRHAQRHLKDPAGARISAEKAVKLAEDLFADSPEPDDQLGLANALNEFGMVLIDVEDIETALIQQDRAIEIAEALKTKNPDDVDTLLTLSRFYTNRSISMYHLGRMADAVKMSLKLIAIREDLYKRPDNKEVLSLLIRAYLNHSTYLIFSGNNLTALTYFEKGIELLESIPEESRTVDHWIFLARTHFNKATTVTNLGRFETAADLCRQSAGIYTRLAKTSDDSRIQDELIKVYINQAYVVSCIGQFQRAEELYRHVTESLEELVYRKARGDLYPDLGLTYFNHGHIHLDREDYASAMTKYGKSRDIWEGLIKRKGRDSFENHYLNSIICYAWTRFQAGGKENYKDILEQAMNRLETLNLTRPDLATDLARAQIFMAYVLEKSGETIEARTLITKAISILGDALEKDARFDTKRDYELAKTLLDRLNEIAS